MVCGACGGEHCGAEGRTVVHHHGETNRILEFTHVARPCVADEAPFGIGRKSVEALAFLRRDAGKEVAGDRDDVFPPVSQRRHADRNDVEAIIQVLPEGTFLRHGTRIAVGAATRRRSALRRRPSPTLR